jgi:hypothetical protein
MSAHIRTTEEDVLKPIAERVWPGRILEINLSGAPGVASNKVSIYKRTVFGIELVFQLAMENVAAKSKLCLEAML